MKSGQVSPSCLDVQLAIGEFLRLDENLAGFLPGLAVRCLTKVSNYSKLSPPRLLSWPASYSRGGHVPLPSLQVPVRHQGHLIISHTALKLLDHSLSGTSQSSHEVRTVRTTSNRTTRPLASPSSPATTEIHKKPCQRMHVLS